MASTPSSHVASVVPTLRVSRVLALTRAVIWLVPAAILCVSVVSLYRGLHFVPSGISNRSVDYAVALIGLPFCAIALWTAWNAVRWLLLAAWPARLGIFASERQLILRLGPFGTRVFDAGRLDIRYPYECAGDDDGGFEAFLPEEQQQATLLPRIAHPDARAPLHRTILKFALGDEADVAVGLRPAIERWRALHPPKRDG